MKESELRILGRADGIVAFSLHSVKHQVNLSESPESVQCITLDLLSGQYSEIATLAQFNAVFPLQQVESELEQEVLQEIVQEVTDKKILNEIERRLGENDTN